MVQIFLDMLSIALEALYNGFGSNRYGTVP